MEELKAVLQIKLESLCVEGGTPSKGLTAPKKDPRSRSSSTISLKSCTGAGSNESDGGTSVENKADDPALNVTYEVETSGESIGDDAKNDELLETYMKRKLGQIEGNSRIPKLFVKDYKVKSVLQSKIRDESRQLLLQRRNDELFDHDELINLWKKLEEKATSVDPLTGEKLLYYSDFRKFVDELEGRKNLKSLKKFLTAKLFLKLYTDDPAGRVSANSVFNYIMKRTWYQQTRVGLSIYDDNGRGYITDKNLECYIQELIPTLPRLNGMDPTFLPFYTGTAVRKFFFFLDPYHTGRIKILDILSCGFIDDFLDLREETIPQENNWFSHESAMDVYARYLNLDKDHNGMLSKEEFINYNNKAALTSTFVDRLFQECLTFDGEMDYRTYLDFVLAVENRKEPASILYFFRIMDVDHKGHLNAFDFNYFYKEIETYMIKSTPEPVKFCDIKDEIFDMIKPKDPLKVTFQDLVNSGSGHTVMHILTDYKGFWMYESRESPSSSDTGTNSSITSEV